jgi:signal transduction histidine kinase
MSNLQEFLSQIRHAWIQRIAHALARGSEVREPFRAELEQFFEALKQAAASGNAAWLDPVLQRWADSATQTELQGGENNLSFIINQMIAITQQVARDSLPPEDALDFIISVLPYLTYSLEKAARLEMEKRITYISDQLLETQQKLERLDRSKSDFIAVAAHELKTPLTLIEGYVSMMRDQVLNAELSSPPHGNLELYIQGVNNGIRRLRDILEDMIDVSLIDNNLLSLNLQPVLLNHLFGLLKSEFAEAVHARRQRLDVNPFPGSEQILYADPERLYQAFCNIVSNAIKYTPDGGRIRVDGRMLPGFVEVIISDTGIGISPENQQLVFEKFTQLGQTSLHSSGKIKFKGGGPGLGLSIARGIIESHGGAIWVESEGYDEVKCPGSTFHILLPIRSGPDDPKLVKLFGGKISSGPDEA